MPFNLPPAKRELYPSVFAVVSNRNEAVHPKAPLAFDSYIADNLHANTCGNDIEIHNQQIETACGV